MSAHAANPPRGPRASRPERWFRPWWLVLLVPIALGLTRLRFETDVLDLLPRHVRAVEGVKLYQQKFSNSRELIITVESADRETTTQAAQAIAEKLRAETNVVAEVTWQPPWQEQPGQTAELIAHLWLNQPPHEFASLAARLAETNLPAVLAATREELATTLSPQEIARLGYDPFGLTRLPESVAATAAGFGPGEELFASADGKFRVVFVKSRDELPGYRECSAWLAAMKQLAASTIPRGVTLGFTGRPAFVAEISASMKRDIVLSVNGTAVIIAGLFWLAHRRWKPMLWLLVLLAVILGSTLALGGLLFGAVNVVSMGFAAILLGLAVDYAVVHYQEALAHPDLTVPQIRRAIAPSILWAAITTIAAFLVLNFGGLPGLAQLGSLVGIGVTLAAFVMIFAFLPPLFPERMHRGTGVPPVPLEPRERKVTATASAGPIAIVTALVVVICAAVLLRGWPGLDASSKALQPRDSQAYTTLEAMKRHLAQNRDPLWLIVAGANEGEVARRLAAAQSALNSAMSNGVLESCTLPTALWPQPENQTANRATAPQLLARRPALRETALAAGFAADALGLTDALLDTWQRAVASPGVFWPTNPVCSWIFDKLAVREATNQFAVGFLFPPTSGVNAAALTEIERQLPADGVWLASWELLGGKVLGVVQQNLWKLTGPMVGLVLLSLWLAFRRPAEVLLSLGVLLLSGLVLLAVMRVAGWSWNLLNLMAVPLILGTGVDYSLFMQLALRRHRGDVRVAHRSVGRALLLCGGTAVAGFGSLAFSSNAGMASLGRVCAVGIAANMLMAIFLLPAWWKLAGRHAGPSEANRAGGTPARRRPSSLYGARLWQAGLWLARVLPVAVSRALARAAAFTYWAGAAHRRATVRQNLLPVFDGDRAAAARAARKLFTEFALKLVDLWRHEAGLEVLGANTDWQGWEHFTTPLARGRGVLLVTPHLGNWELGAVFFVRQNVPLLVLTLAEPDTRLTGIRQASRARRGIETLVVGENPFAAIEIIKRLQAGATVALLVDRPPAPTAVEAELFGRPLMASSAVAELARASGCAIVPGIIVRSPAGYTAHILPEIRYDRAAIGHREGRLRLTREILRAFEPAIRQHPEQWYHFVPIWS